MLNKCDLVGLREVADVEDKIDAVAPGVRVVRARFGAVDVRHVLHVGLEGGGKVSNRGSEAFMSHEEGPAPDEGTFSVECRDGVRIGGALRSSQRYHVGGEHVGENTNAHSHVS